MTDDALTCTGCGRETEPEDMCWCRDPLCWPCHDDSGHHWRTDWPRPGGEAA